MNNETQEIMNFRLFRLSNLKAQSLIGIEILLKALD